MPLKKRGVCFFTSIIFDPLTTYLWGAGVCFEIPVPDCFPPPAGASSLVSGTISSRINKTANIIFLINNPYPLFHGIGHDGHIGFFIILCQNRFLRWQKITGMALTMASPGNIIKNDVRDIIMVNGVIVNGPAVFKKEGAVDMLRILFT